MQILYDNIIKTATITSSSEASDYEWDTALNDIRLSRVGRTTGDSSEWLKFAFDTVQTVDYVAILGHNLSEDAVITLEGNNTDSWGSPSFSEQVSLADTGNFYSTKRVNGQVFQDVSNSFDGTSPTDYIQWGTKDYNWFTDNPTNFQHGSIYESIPLDLKSESGIRWKSAANVELQFRDSIDGSSWSSWTTPIDDAVTTKRDKVLRYMQVRVLMTGLSWDDTSSYFELLTPSPLAQDIIIKSTTEATYKFWRLTFVDSLNPAGYIEIGNIFLGDSLAMPGMDVNKIVAKKTNSTYTKNLGGQLFSNPRVQLKYSEITFTDIIDEYKNNVERFSDTVDITIPFVLLIWEDDLDIEPPIYCNLTESIPFTKSLTDYISWNFTIKCEECK